MTKINKGKVIPVECYSRVVGYFRPVNQWNPGKQVEFADRKMNDLNKIERKII